MFTVITATVISLAVLLAYPAYRRYRKIRQRRTLDAASAAGVAIDEEGNIHAGLTYAAMMAREQISGVPYTGARAEFLQLIRLISEGPETVDEIRFLLDKGMEPVVRPDGLVYVPCPENEHLSMPGEIALTPEDLAEPGEPQDTCRM